jgi:hypothetical protein
MGRGRGGGGNRAYILLGAQHTYSIQPKKEALRGAGRVLRSRSPLGGWEPLVGYSSNGQLVHIRHRSWWRLVEAPRVMLALVNAELGSRSESLGAARGERQCPLLSSYQVLVLLGSGLGGPSSVMPMTHTGPHTHTHNI